MKEKFSYFDFLCNIIIGTLLLWAIMTLINELNTEIKFATDNVITDSLLLVILAFIIGHALQAKAKKTIEPALNKKYWYNSSPQQIYLIKEKSFCPKIKRDMIIGLLIAKFGFSEKDINKLNQESKEAKDLSEFCSYLCFTFLTDKGIGEKANIQNCFYYFFRGLTLSSLYSSIIFGSLFLYALITKLAIRPIELSCDFELIYPLVLAVLLFYFHYLFRDGAKLRAEAHIHEVFTSVIGYFVPYSKEKKKFGLLDLLKLLFK